MKKLRNRKVLCAAIAAVSLTAVPAFAQLRAGQDGHSNDASNRVGSGGYNAAGSVYNNGLSNNNLIYRDVTGLSGFTGPVGERDPRAFTGPVSSTGFDNDIRISSGAPTAYQAPLIGNTPTAFYGGARDVAPPIGTERIGYTQSYIGTDLTPSNPFSLGSDINAALDVQRQKYGESTVLGVNSKFLDNGNPNNQDISGPLEAQNQANTFLGSPLYGIQGTSGLDNTDATDAGLPIFATPSSSSTGTGRFRFQNSEVGRMRSELLQNNLDDQQQSQNGVNPGANGNNNNQSPSAIQDRNLAQPIEGPNSKRITSQQDNSALGNGNITSGLNTQQATQQRMTLMSPKQQSEQYNILAQRLAQLTPSLVRTQQADAEYHTQLNQQRTKAAADAAGGATSRPAMSTGPGELISPGAATNSNIQPLKIESLADGVAAPGLHGLLKDAEDLMHSGKFESAIQKYNIAQRVAPNNGLIPLGRANAELGAGYYYQASADLHQVFQADPALLMGQYNLKNWIRDERMSFITKELRDLSNADKKQETPAFLLAYISYNTGQESQAETYLREARSRARGQDPLLSELEARWKLSTPAGFEGNK
jgi:hypothetical protein